jgi:hypothetical protein
MAEVLTRDEMNSRFDSEWVLVEDPEVDAQLRVVRGKVIYHTKNRDELDRKMIELRPKSSATVYTGKMPANTAIVL